MAETQQVLLPAIINGKTGKRINITHKKISRHLIHYRDEGAAQAIIMDQADKSFDAENAGAVAGAALDVKMLDEAYAESSKTLAKLNAKLEQTPPIIEKTVSGSGDGSGNDSTSFKGMPLNDRITIILCYLFGLGLCVVSGSTVYANLQASGNAIFLEQPWISVAMSMLAPAGTIGMKYAAHLLPFGRPRRLYRGVMIFTGLLSFFAWIIAFVLIFNGLSENLDWDDAGENVINIAWYTALQLFAEISIGGALFMTADHVLLKYSGMIYIHNLEYKELLRIKKNHEKVHQALHEKRKAAHQINAALKAQKQLRINQDVAEFVGIKARLSDIHLDG